MLGLDESIKAIRNAVGSYDGRGVMLVLVSGPRGSGKTSISAEALEFHNYVVYSFTAGESVQKESEKAIRFSKTTHSVEALINGTTSRRRALFVDDCFPDTKSIATVFDTLKKAKCNVLMLASLNGSAKAQDVRRRASVTVTVGYPSKKDIAALLKEKFGSSADDETYDRCAQESGGAVMKAIQLVRGELYGTEARNESKGDTIFDDVAKGIALCLSGKSFNDVEASVSNEPSMAAMILRESIPNASPGTRQAFRDMSKTPPGTRIGAIAAAVAFAETASRERGSLKSGSLKFPRCYTVASSRICNIKKRSAAQGNA